MKAAVPDLAIVPKLSITSSLVIPMPLSSMVMVLASALAATRIRYSAVKPANSGSLMTANRCLSMASEALEISSLKNISRFEYKE